MRTDYEQLAARYDEDRARFSIPRDDLIGALLTSRESVRVLDVGCGTGRWLAAQRDLFDASRVALVGVDPSAAMLAETRTKRAVTVARAGAEALPFADDTIDYVMTSFVFHHVVAKERALDEVRRVLTAGGVFRLENIEPGAARNSWVYEFFPETVAIDAARFWPPERIADGLVARGFGVDSEVAVEHEELAVTEVLADAERRVVSQLAVLDDQAYARGLANLRAMPAEAVLESTQARLRVTARLS